MTPTQIKIAIAGGVCLLCVIILVVIIVLIDKGNDSANKAGNAEAVATSAAVHIQEAEKANEARTELTHRTDSQRKSDCLRYARNPEDC